MKRIAKPNELISKAIAAKEASLILSNTDTKQKNYALSIAAKNIYKNRKNIIKINKREIARAKKNKINSSFIDRMFLDEKRIKDISNGLQEIILLDDPIGSMEEVKIRPNGMQVGKRRVPIGVIGAIFESRPNVTIEIASLCLKSGNSVIMRSGSDAHESSKILAEIFIKSMQEAGLPSAAIGFINNTDRKIIEKMLKLSNYIDLIIPRGGAELINLVKKKSQIPVVAGGIGVCHTYVDKDADLNIALNIVENAKIRRPSVCNTLDTILVHEDIAHLFLKEIQKRFKKNGVTMHVDKKANKIITADKLVTKIKPGDYAREWLSLDCSIKIVSSINEAIEHINNIGSGHSEAIATSSYSAANQFQNKIDAASVFVNVSTGFADGAEYGLGNEFGISTQKLHARGPMGLRELTSYKWIISGNGQIRK
ncbi:MAG: glutamate-5-semialdehyde dehydrogenase [Chloroflexi bacterium]|jgi:glutamate-5-semialdehyde dehydrogenase|nr:MAG: glutamate-5-semialdehyde dehydrogenase [Chloroflexota bacterium]|tara:strand:+ start:4706 stop:5980 length:1275 start_codon:yes stop_codon:yes gene_type:complete